MSYCGHLGIGLDRFNFQNESSDAQVVLFVHCLEEQKTVNVELQALYLILAGAGSMMVDIG